MPTRPPLYVLPGCAPRADRVRRYDNQRGSASARGYDRTWQKVRAQHLSIEPLCRFCHGRGLTVAAEIVDHIVPIARAPGLRLVDSNLRSLCKPCHDAHTAREQSR